MSLRLLSRFPKSLLKDEKHFVRKQPLSSQAVRRREPLQKGVVSDRLSVPSHIVCPEYSLTGRPHQSPRSVALYSEDDIPRLRKAARLARKMLEFANSLVTPGITTDEIDRLTHAEIVKHGAYPTPLNYCHFPKSICTSVNEVVCHGIPDSTVLQEGDIVSIDVSLYIDGFHGDNCGTVTCGIANPKLVALIAATKDAVDRAIAVCGPGRCISEIGSVIQVHHNYFHCQQMSVTHSYHTTSSDRKPLTSRTMAWYTSSAGMVQAR